MKADPPGGAGRRPSGGSKTILDDYLREVRPLFSARPRSFQRTSYRPAALCQFDLWQPSREIPVGCGQTRRGYVVVGCLPYSRAGAGTLVFSNEAPDLLYGIGDCLAKLGALPETLVWDREGALHAGGGRPSDPFAALCGELRVGWRFCEPRDPQSKGVVERLQGYLETSFEPGRSFVGVLQPAPPPLLTRRHQPRRVRATLPKPTTRKGD